ncbi:hypothetical protein BDF20DRAFT_253797 [Mycotypha africana]|uniref:uncharacterized protein n=1 Tax=Mycotypha africana TaxID=64632 RepID=UPI0023008412|nr:uncharacterized protein BDF20DRAFT_253797 [Mycotypha africana]KAI8987254.1 hypothetical protein BDF20DRAFT_253797 [Mycotypha africana]
MTSFVFHAIKKDSSEGEAAEKSPEEGLTFRLFASQPITNVSIEAETDNTDNLAKLVAEQQVYEFDETDPIFKEQVQQAAVDYDTIIRQSAVPYPAMKYLNKIMHISPEGIVLSKVNQAEKDKKRKRKSKKCRAFEKAVKEGKIKVAPKMRNPSTPNGWPGWPGIKTKVDIINYQMPKSGGYRQKKPDSRGLYDKPFNKKPFHTKHTLKSSNKRQ